MRAAPGFPAGGAFSTIVLQEPAKSEVLAFTPGATFTRQAFGIVVDRRANKTFETVVDLKSLQLVSWTEVQGQPPLLEENTPSCRTS